MVALAVFMSACSGSEPGGDSAITSASGALLPLETGNSWSYRVTEDGELTQKTTSVGEPGPVGGSGPSASIRAYEITTRKGADMMDLTQSWQGPSEDDADVIVRYRELSYGAMTQALQLEEYWTPYRLVADGSSEHTQNGAEWLDRYGESKIPAGGAMTGPDEQADDWTVVSADEAISVPKGRFEHAVHLRKVAGSENVKEYWYVRGVGKVKEAGGQIEELTDYRVAHADGAQP